MKISQSLWGGPTDGGGGHAVLQPWKRNHQEGWLRAPPPTGLAPGPLAGPHSHPSAANSTVRGPETRQASSCREQRYQRFPRAPGKPQTQAVDKGILSRAPRASRRRGATCLSGSEHFLKTQHPCRGNPPRVYGGPPREPGTEPEESGEGVRWGRGQWGQSGR